MQHDIGYFEEGQLDKRRDLRLLARLLPFFDRRPGRVFDVEAALAADLASLEDPAQKEQIARSQYESGRITFNESRAMVGQAPPYRNFYDRE